MSRMHQLKYPPGVFWEITGLCNHNCIHCFNYWRKESEKELSDLCIHPDAVSLKKVAEKIVQNKPVRVVITGGEPLLAFESIKPSLQILLQNRIYVSFNTNAALVNDKIAKYFCQNNISVFVSFPSVNEKEFDYITDTSGAYKKVITGLDLLHNNRNGTVCNMVVSKVNLNSVYNTAEFLKSRYEFKKIHITRVSAPINAGENFNSFLLTHEDMASYARQCAEIKEKLNMEVRASTVYTPCSLYTEKEYSLFAFENSCEAGISSYVISSTGKVRACVRDIKEYGDILSESFSDIWGRMAEWRSGELIPDECRDCSVVAHCRGGCRVDGVAKCSKRNQLDCYSAPVLDINKFYKPKQPLPDWSEKTVFRLSENLAFVEENFAVRVSHSSNYVYCTKDFAGYLKENQEFTIKEFCAAQDVGFETAKNVLYTLYRNRLATVQASKTAV